MNPKQHILMNFPELIEAVERVVNNLASAITSSHKSIPGPFGDPESLTESVAGVAAGLCRIADALDAIPDALGDVADAIIRKGGKGV